jgi:hypothetical protein
VAKALYPSGSPYAPQSCGERLIAAIRPALAAFSRCRLGGLEHRNANSPRSG